MVVDASAALTPTDAPAFFPYEAEADACAAPALPDRIVSFTHSAYLDINRAIKIAIPKAQQLIDVIRSNGLR